MKLVLIGGGDYGTKPEKLYNLKEIDEKIIALSGKTHPRLLFLSFSIKSNYTFGFMKKYYTQMGAQCEQLCFSDFGNAKTVEGKFKRADIIYIGGGNTIHFMNILKKFGLDEKIIEVSKQNKVIAGRSAGGIIISAFGSSDSRKYQQIGKFTCVKGLGILDIVFAPHYINSGRESDMPRLMKNKKKFVAIGVDSCAALVVNDKNFEIVSTDKNSCGYKCFYNKNSFIQKKLDNFGKLNDLIAKQ